MPNLKLILSVALLTIFVGCTTTSGPAFPQASAGFEPRRTYSHEFDTVWNAVIDSLDENRIAIASSDKENGRIQTDHIAGATTTYFAHLGGVGNSRYSYSIRLTKSDTAPTKVLILAKLEQSLAGGSGATPFRDLSQQNQPIVKNLENWLYQEIEKRLPQ